MAKKKRRNKSARNRGTQAARVAAATFPGSTKERTQKKSQNKRQSRAERRLAQKKRQRISTYAALGVLATAVIAFFLWPRPEAIHVPQARLDDNPSLGDLNAPVTLTELGDLTCSACRSWHQAGVLEQILDQYDGLVRVEWRDFPIITPDSPKAAEAGQCAYDQGRFWDFLDRVYSEPGSSYTNATVPKLKRYAQEIGLDSDQFNACLDSGQHEETVDYDLDFSRGMGLRGTPSFLVNGQAIIGANPDLLIQSIEAALVSQ